MGLIRGTSNKKGTSNGHWIPAYLAKLIYNLDNYGTTKTPITMVIHGLWYV